MAATGEAGRAGLDPQARSRLEEELGRLRERRRTLGAALDNRDPVGDRADSAEALELADDAAWLDERIDALVGRLAGGAGAEQPATDRLPDGAVVTVRFGDGTEQTLRVVAIPEEIPEGEEDAALTSHSPLSRALAGHAEGDTVTFATPEGPAQAELLSLTLPDAS